MNALETSIYSLLKDDSGLKTLTGGESRVFNAAAPFGQALPLAVFSQASGIEENNISTQSIIMRYLVKGIAVRGIIAGQIAARIDALLNGATLSVDGWTAYRKARQETTVRYQERDPSGRVINHSGAVYIVWLEA